MALASPFYRGIYAYDASKKPNGTTVKASPFYRGIYAYDATKKPSGTLDIEGASAPLAFMAPATGNTTPEGAEEAVSTEAVEPAPWDTMTQHAQLDAFVNDSENGILAPSGWSSMTIAQKKLWLDDNG